MSPIADVVSKFWSGHCSSRTVRVTVRVGDVVLDSAALDRYTFIRNGYLQRRRYLIYDGKVPADQQE